MDQMGMTRRGLFAALGVAVFFAAETQAQTVSLDPRNAVYQAAGGAGTGGTNNYWNLWSNGDVRSFTPWDTPANVPLTIRAEGQAAVGQDPLMDISVAGQNLAT